METTILNVLFISAAGLLVAVTAGIFYLTALEWRNRRQLEQEKRSRR